MSATANHPGPGIEENELAPICRVLVLHEDYTTHVRALDLCRHVMEHFGDQLEFDVKSWSAGDLAELASARLAARNAAMADIVLLSLKTVELPAGLAAWLEAHFIVRLKPEGMLALVVDEIGGPPAVRERTLLQLTQLARRIGLDFTSFISENVTLTGSTKLPDHWPPVVTLVDEPPERAVFDHWGLNE